MDDPWGSPWATADNTATPSSSPSKNILEPPPPAFLSTPNNLNIPSSQSAWLDDDGFGDWASPDPGAATNASPWTWGNDAAPTEGLTPSYEPRRKSSTPKWPQSRSTSPGVRPSITPNSVSPGRSSPDPWANHLPTFTRDEPEPLAQLPQIPDAPPLVLEPAQGQPGLTGPLNDALEEEITAQDPIIHRFDEPLQFGGAIAFDVSPAAPELEGALVPSSASTTSDDDDDDDEAPDARHANSPITSIEDNPLPKTTQRKPSGKVLELVEMYDGIAKRITATPERAPPSRRSASREPESRRDEVPAYDLDKPESIDNELVAPIPSPTAESDPVASLPAGDDTAQETSETDRPKRPDHDPFEVDLSKLDLLLPGVLSQTAEPAEDVPDRIIHDSFTSISERKMWYRLSRHESLRKHNAGDDENYVRINWTSSTLRQETLLTVRRWMEEDSFGGRAFRGGVVRSTGGKSFGWDSTTAASPVDLDRVFGRKQKRQASVHRPTHSMGGLPSLSTAPMLPSSTSNTPASAHSKDNWDGLATFGWSSGAGDAKATTGAKASEPSAFAIPLPLAFTGFDNKPKSHASLPAFVKPIAPTPPVVNTANNKEEEDDEEDEWGDMVSPTTAEATDSTSIPKTSWDSFSTNPLPDSTSTAPSDSLTASTLVPDALRSGNNDTEDIRSKSGVKDIGKVISPTPTSTSSFMAAGVPQSQDSPLQPPASTYTFRPSSTAKRPPNISIAATLSGPLDPLQSGKSGVFAGGTLETPVTLGFQTPSTAQPQNSTEDDDLVQQFVRKLPDLSYMLR
ncbi:hypothetical protein EsH8_III_000023 [Colletotrichum jinshuiense]